MKSLSKDIRFWILLLVLIRLVGVTNPPLENSHSWRQTTVTMVARNYYETDPNILYPRIDIGGDLTGITGMEFPVLNYLIYILSLVFGYGHWYGRLINLLVSSLGCWYFYLLLRRFFSERISFYSTLMLLVSIWFAYSRKIMPDTFSMSLVIIGMYYGVNYLYENGNRVKNVLLYVVLTMAGVLSKLPSGYILVVFLLPLIDKEVMFKRKALFCAVSAVICMPVAWWYLLWVPHLVSTYGFEHFFMGKGFAEGCSEVMANFGDALKHFYSDALKFIGFGVFLLGLVMCFVRRNKLALYIFGLSFVAFCIVILKSGWTFTHHEYYIIPFVPPMALIGGCGLAAITNTKLRVVLMVAVAMEGILNQHCHFVIREPRKPLLQLESDLDRFTCRDDLIVINSGENPTAMYFAHRKGWVAGNDQLSDTNYLNDLRKHGCKCVVVMKRALGENVDMQLPLLLDNENYAIYHLE